MYSKKEWVEKQRAFWTAFGLYMKPVPASGWEKVNWVNYKTGLKNLHFRLDAGRTTATVSVEMSGADTETRMRLLNTFILLREDFEEIVGLDWAWEQEAKDEFGNPVTRLVRYLDDVDLMKESDWPAMIGFFKETMTRLDAFWFSNKDIFVAAVNSL